MPATFHLEALHTNDTTQGELNLFSRDASAKKRRRKEKKITHHLNDMIVTTSAGKCERTQSTVCYDFVTWCFFFPIIIITEPHFEFFVHRFSWLLKIVKHFFAVNGVGVRKAHSK